MNLIELILIGYLVVTVAIFIRYFKITLKVRDNWREQDIDFEVSDYVSRMVGDAVMWPFYIIWFGLKEFIKELK